MTWKLIDTGTNSAEENMRTDAELLESIDKAPILHLYDWVGPSATYGYFTKPENYLNLEAVSKAGITLARRPTGGGIIFHTYDLAFSIIIPGSHPAYSTNTLQNYYFVNQMVIDVIRRFNNTLAPQLLPEESLPKDITCANFCMAKPTQYDVMIEGKKIGGAAQRRTKRGFLHQGSISLSPPEPKCKDYFLNPTVYDAMMVNTHPLLKEPYSPASVHLARKELKKLFKSSICNLSL